MELEGSTTANKHISCEFLLGSGGVGRVHAQDIHVVKGSGGVVELKRVLERAVTQCVWWCSVHRGLEIVKETIPFRAICGGNHRGKRIAAIRQAQLSGCDGEGVLADHGATKRLLHVKSQRKKWMALF